MGTKIVILVSVMIVAMIATVLVSLSIIGIKFVGHDCVIDGVMIKETKVVSVGWCVGTGPVIRYSVTLYHEGRDIPFPAYFDIFGWQGRVGFGN